jgi:hypothetical protein
MKCAGQDSRFWSFDSIFNISCPQCGQEIEFFKDDTSRLCKKCGHTVINPKIDFGCASHCKFAAQCLGTLPPELIKEKEDLLKDRIAVEIKHYFGHDFKSIGRIVNRVNYAESICKKEKGDMGIILPAAYLYNMEVSEVRKILLKIEAQEKMIDEICDVLHNSFTKSKEQNINAQILHDAAMLALLKEKLTAVSTQEKSSEACNEKDFKTETGRKMAETMKITSKQVSD